MKKTIVIALSALAFAAPAMAQDDEASGPISVSGTAALVSDYRFRGVSQTNEEAAVQAGFTVSHESGFYVGAWGSNLAGWGTFGGANMELDLYGGFTAPIGGATVDVGLTWYMYPGGADKTDFAEPYVKVSGSVGPASLLAGVAYAPKQEALGNYLLPTPTKEDNFYIWGDASVGIPDTPLKLKAHLGYSDGNPGLGPNGTSIAPTGKYLDWMLGADLALGPLTLGVSYIDTDISEAEAFALPGFASTKDGSVISGETVVFSLSATF